MTSLYRLDDKLLELLKSHEFELKSKLVLTYALLVNNQYKRGN